MSTITNYSVNGTDLGSIFQPFTYGLTTINSNLNGVTVATSADGKYVYSANSTSSQFGTITSASFLYSSNYGASFTSQNNNIVIDNIVTSNDGKYILISGIDLYYSPSYGVSFNFGSSWTYFNTNASNINPNGTAISSSGQYMVVCFLQQYGLSDNGIIFSNDYGVTWNKINTNLSFTGLAYTFCSDDCKYIYVSCDTGIYLLTANGSEPYTINSYTLSNNLFPNNDVMCIGCSSDGKNVYANILTENTSINQKKIYYSFNYGSNFNNSIITVPNSQYSVNYPISNFLILNGNNQTLLISFVNYQNLSNPLFSNYISNDFGKTWTSLVTPANTLYIIGLAVNLNLNSFIILTNNKILYNYTLPAITNTGYISNGTDISQLFQPYTSGVYGPQTNYLTSTGVDLNTLFTVNTTFYNSYPTYTLTGTGTTQTLNGYTIVTFTVGTGSITFNKPVTNFGCICVAGGGGGSPGNSRTSGKGSGNGGGGGGAYLYTTNPNITTTSLKYNVSVGNGGSGGTSSILGTNGGSSYVTINGNTIINCVGGKCDAGGGGNVTIPAGVTYNGGNGGNNTNGFSSTSYTTPFTIPSAITSVVKTSYGGGGGGAGGNTNGGAAGLNGLGGTQSGNTNTNRYGQDATSYGSGGGGGGNIGVLSSGGIIYYNGGDGAPGVVIFYFQ